MYRRDMKRRFSEFPTGAKIVIGGIAGIIALWIVAVVVSVLFFPNLYR